MPASPALSPTLSGTAPEPAVVAKDVAVAWEDAVLGCRGICTGAAAALVGSVQRKLHCHIHIHIYLISPLGCEPTAIHCCHQIH